MKKIIVGIIIIIIATLTVLHQQGFLGSKSGTNNQKLTIGYIAPLTGDTVAIGEAVQRMALIAQDTINSEGGVGGMKLEIDFQDGLCTGVGALNAVQKIVHIDKRDFVFATCSGEALAVLPVTEQAGSLLIGPIATSPDLTGASDLFVRTYQSDAEQGRLFAEYVNENREEMVAVLQEQTDYAQGIVKVFTENYGGQIVKEEFSTGTSDFRTQLAKLQESGAETLLISLNGEVSATKVLTQLRATNWRPTIVTEEANGNALGLLAEFKDILNGGITVKTVLEEGEQLMQLREEYKNRYNEEIPFESLTVTVYDALILLDEGIEAVGSDPVEFAHWYKSLSGWDKGVTGPVTINQDGDRVAVSTLVRIVDGELTEVE